MAQSRHSRSLRRDAKAGGTSAIGETLGANGGQFRQTADSNDNILTKIIDIFKKLFEPLPLKTRPLTRDELPESLKTKDGLIGTWTTELDGGLHMISGQALEFKKNGEGFYYSWATTDPDPYNYKEQILWKWIDEKTITIKVDTPEGQWEQISYEINSCVGDNDIHYKRLTSPNFRANEYFKEGFWKILSPLVQPIK